MSNEKTNTGTPVATAEEILKQYGWDGILPFDENITMYFHALIQAMEEYRSLPSTAPVTESEIIKVYDEYIQLLTDELNEVVPGAYLHGWKSKRFEKGKELRSKIESLKSVLIIK